MRKNVTLSVLVLLISTVILAEDRNIQGTVSRVDNKEKTLIVKEGEESESTVSWNESTEVSGDLQEGVRVEIVASEADGKLRARSIRVVTGKDDLP